MAETDAAVALCPPHHWLITQQAGSTAVQLWECRRCGASKEVAVEEAEQGARQSPYSWGAGRPQQRGRPASTDTPAAKE